MRRRPWGKIIISKTTSIIPRIAYAIDGSTRNPNAIYITFLKEVFLVIPRNPYLSFLKANIYYVKKYTHNIYIFDQHTSINFSEISNSESYESQ